MWKTVAPAAAVLTAEAVIRRKINALPAETFPLRIGRRVQLRRAHNRGLLCSKLAQKPRAAAALQTVSAAALAAMAAVCVCRRHGAADRHGPDARRRAGQPHRALGARVGHGLCVPAACGHPVFPAHHLERGRPERPDRLHHGSDRTAVRKIVIMSTKLCKFIWQSNKGSKWMKM